MMSNQGPRRTRRGQAWCLHLWRRLVQLLVRMLAVTREQRLVNDLLREEMEETTSSSAHPSTQPVDRREQTSSPSVEG